MSGQDAPEDCPGMGQEASGKTSACAGCPMKQMCQSGTVPVDPDLELVKARMSTIARKILVLSGKGGVGKSTVAAQLSFALASDNSTEVGLLDLDLCGPSIPRMLGVEKGEVTQTMLGWTPVYVEPNLAVMSIAFLLQGANDAVIWRGPRKNGLIKNFLKDVHWDNLDFLICDTPPGTTDEHISVAQFLKDSGIDGAVLVTTPQEVALSDVRREVTFCKKVNIPILGIIENMSGFVCPHCKAETAIFQPTTGGGKQLADESGVPFLGRIPLDPSLMLAGEEGKGFLSEGVKNDSPTSTALAQIIKNLKEEVEKKRKKTDLH